MTTEIIKGVIAVVIIIGAIVSIVIQDVIAQEFLIPLAVFTFGYYFKQSEQPVVARCKTAFANRKK